MNTDPSRPIGFRRSAPFQSDLRGIRWRFWIGPLLVRRTVRGVRVGWTR